MTKEDISLNRKNPQSSSMNGGLAVAALAIITSECPRNHLAEAGGLEIKRGNFKDR